MALVHTPRINECRRAQWGSKKNPETYDGRMGPTRFRIVRTLQTSSGHYSPLLFPLTVPESLYGLVMTKRQKARGSLTNQPHKKP